MLLTTPFLGAAALIVATLHRKTCSQNGSGLRLPRHCRQLIGLCETSPISWVWEVLGSPAQDTWGRERSPTKGRGPPHVHTNAAAGRLVPKCCTLDSFTDGPVQAHWLSLSLIAPFRRHKLTRNSVTHAQGNITSGTVYRHGHIIIRLDDGLRAPFELP